MILRWWLSVSLALWLSGCGMLTLQSRMQDIVEGLNRREVSACIYFLGYLGPYLHMRTITATGGMALERCLPSSIRFESVETEALPKPKP